MSIRTPTKYSNRQKETGSSETAELTLTTMSISRRKFLKVTQHSFEINLNVSSENWAIAPG